MRTCIPSKTVGSHGNDRHVFLANIVEVSKTHMQKLKEQTERLGLISYRHKMGLPFEYMRVQAE